MTIKSYWSCSTRLRSSCN